MGSQPSDAIVLSDGISVTFVVLEEAERKQPEHDGRMHVIAGADRWQIIV